MLAFEVAGDRLDQDRVRRDATDTAGLPQREDPFHSSITFLIVSALHQLVPEYGKPQRAVSSVIGGLDALFRHKRLQRTQLSLQRAGQCPDLIPER